MRTIQVILDEPLLEAADRVAESLRINRSTLIRRALRWYLKIPEVREKERLDREGYERLPDTGDGADLWEQAASWPAK